MALPVNVNLKYRVVERKYITQEQFNDIYTTAEEAKKKALGLIHYLKKTNIKGPKFNGR